MESIEVRSIEEAIALVEYDAISKAMKILDWKHVEDREEGIGFYHPTPSELKNTVTRLITDASEAKLPEFDINGDTEYYVSSGGFTVRRRKSNDSNFELYSVSFEISINALIV